ncbi:MAG: C39 family peptidase [Planctomycetota bacterium]|nr:C39 family peptidase [Planctomycetota bacterium]
MFRRLLFTIVALLASLSLFGFSAVPVASNMAAESAAAYRSTLIRDVPHIRQKPDFCGEACAAMFLQCLGHPCDQDAVFDQAGLDPLKGRGCFTRELNQALHNVGFETGPVWHHVQPARAAAQMERLWKALHDDLANGIPSIVCMHYDRRAGASEHFRLLLGYDAKSDEVVYHEPAERDGGYRRMTRATFLQLWPLKYRQDRWTVVRLRLQAGRIKPPRPARGLTDADYAQHIRKLQRRLPDDDFHYVIQRPFIVIGDESPERVRRRAQGTIRWAVEKLKQDYFSQDPAQIIDIWLFKDKASYNKHTQALFGEQPTTPFGYYSPAHRALIMNISTGGGTLVHEIVHPFIAANFPNCPAWFNEGLASLYEQCGEVDQKIYGYTNWRLPGLQRAIRADQVPTFETLCSSSTREFYDDHRGTNYAQARYLCYYLQEQGKLRDFYHAFRKDAQRDATGLSTLRSVLDERDLQAFQKSWSRFVLNLNF